MDDSTNCNNNSNAEDGGMNSNINKDTSINDGFQPVDSSLMHYYEQQYQPPSTTSNDLSAPVFINTLTDEEINLNRPQMSLSGSTKLMNPPTHHPPPPPIQEHGVEIASPPPPSSSQNDPYYLKQYQPPPSEYAIYPISNNIEQPYQPQPFEMGNTPIVLPLEQHPLQLPIQEQELIQQQLQEEEMQRQKERHQQEMQHNISTGLIPMNNNNMTTSSSFLNGTYSIDMFNEFNRLVVIQRPRGKWWELFCSCAEHENEYKIYSPTEQHIFTARETSGGGCLCCCGARRKFKMSIHTVVDNKELLKLKRPFKCFRRGCGCCCCVDTCHQVIHIHSGDDTATPGKYLGRVKERWSLLLPTLCVFDDNDNEIYRIVGSCCGCINSDFTVHRGSGTKEEWGDENESVAMIAKRWSGFNREFLTDADNFYIEFEQNNFNSAHRSLLIGALFLIDYLYYENSNCVLI